MKIVTEFPHRVREIEHLWIALPDGCRLAARLWIPEDADHDPVPAILEYIPYRKRDRTRERDEPMHHYFAGHGYAAVRVDLRGTGDSEGVLLDEYHERELEDALDVIRWIAIQSWCNGTVGMIGKSWGGFNALQVASLRPKELKAVISVCASDDRYADDAHYMGGCLLNENLIWGSVLFTLTALPPDPELLGQDWRRVWRRRLDDNALFPAIWLQHPRRDDYWKRGSVSEDYARVACAVYAVGGWADGYTNAVPRLLAGLRCPKKGLVGPWAHLYPHAGVPGPAIGFLQEAVKWWELWLKGARNQVMDDPLYRAWMQESASPLENSAVRPGRWIAERAWPSPRIRLRSYALAPGSLYEPGAGGPAARPPLTIRSPQTVGVAAGSWCSFGKSSDMPDDQREDDAGSLVFDSPPLEESFEILGAPIARLRVASDRPVAMVAARVNDVAPDGASTRVTYGLLNLTHRDSHEHPSPLEPGRACDVRVILNDVAYHFAVGHRIRLALSTSYWPIAWPPPEPVTLTVFTDSSALDLPRRDPQSEDELLAPFPPPESGPEADTTDLQPGGMTRTIHRDPVNNELVHTIVEDLDETGEPTLTRVESIGLEFGQSTVARFRIRDDDPLTARGEVLHKAVSRRGAWRVRIESTMRLSSTKSQFRIQAELDAFEGDEQVFSKSWDRAIPRELL